MLLIRLRKIGFFNWEKKNLGESTYKTLSSTILEKSEIPEKRKADLREKSQKVFKYSNLYKNPEIKFNKSILKKVILYDFHNFLNLNEGYKY